MKQITHLGRILDLRYPTHLALNVISIVLSAAVFFVDLFSGLPLLQAFVHSFLAGFATGLVWSISRELDPQQQLSAFVSVILMAIAVFAVDSGFNVLFLLYMLPLLRIVNRSIGLKAKLSDSVFVLLFVAVFAFYSGWIFALIAVFAFLLDAFLPDPDKRHGVFAVLALIVMIVVFVMQGSEISPQLPSTQFMIGIVLAGLIFVPVIWSSRQLTVTGDATKESLNPLRVQSAQILALVSGYLLALWQGNDGILGLLPFWIAIAGTGLFVFIKPFVPDINLEKRRTKQPS